MAIGISSVRLPYCCLHGHHCMLHTFLLVAHWMLITRQLLQAKRNSAFKQTDTLITKLIVHTVETGVITVVTATIDLSLYLKYPNNYLHIVPYVSSRDSMALSLTRIHTFQGTYSRKNVSRSAFYLMAALFISDCDRYSNIALANLNGRTRHRAWGDHTSGNAAQLREIDSRHFSMPRVDKTIVNIQTSITEERDEDSVGFIVRNRPIVCC